MMSESDNRVTSTLSASRTPVNLPYSGPFVNSGGLYTIHHDIFWNRWLLPLLQGVNQGAEIIPDAPFAEYNSGRWPSDYLFKGIRYHVGINGSQTGVTDPYYALATDPRRPRTWTWGGKNRTTSNYVSREEYTRILVLKCKNRKAHISSKYTPVVQTEQRIIG
jgi:hypothetical protein